MTPQRVLVRVAPADVAGGPGWEVRIAEGAEGAEGVEVAVADPYTMAAVAVSGRMVPCVPHRLPAPDAVHASLCAGDAGAIGDLLDRLAARAMAQGDVTRYGRWLFECLLAPAWEAIRALPGVVAGRSVELALCWDVDADLHQLIWESMHDGRATLAGHPDLTVAVTRLVPSSAADPAVITGIPRVLFASGSALSDPVVRPGAMFMGLLRSLDANGQCQARAVQQVSLDDLTAACVRFRPDVVHLVAHGVLLADGRAALLLRDDARRDVGGQREADATALIGALSAAGLPTAVVVSACNTATPTDASPLAAHLVAAGIPVVSAMAGEVSEPACRLYTRRLATALHEGLSLVQASAEGRRAALINSAEPTAEIDWALPALFLAEGLRTGLRLVDGAASRRLVDLANRLDLRREPVFIGRQAIVDSADALLEGDLRVVAVLAKGSTALLGGTRLLREIGWRALRAGHVPLLLGPYAAGSVPPQRARDLVTALLQQALIVSERMDLPASLPLTLQADDSEGGLPVDPGELAGLPAPLARARVRRALVAYSKGEAAVDPDSARDLLAADLAQVATAARTWGPPFGKHTRVVLLCDDVHEWGASGAASSALDCLLAMVRGDGLGTDRCPVPVVLTGSRTEQAGATLSDWSGSGRHGLRVHPLGVLDEEEAVLGYQWVLLHPWETKPQDLEYFHKVYTPAPSMLEKWENVLRTTAREPTQVERELYVAAKFMTVTQVGRSDDDEAAWRSYADRQRAGGSP